MILFYSIQCKHCNILLDAISKHDKNNIIKTISIDTMINNNYDIDKITNKKLKRKGFKISKKFLKKHKGLKNNKNNIVITPSWGGKQFLLEDDMILYELDNPSKYYGIDKQSFKNTYN